MMRSKAVQMEEEIPDPIEFSEEICEAMRRLEKDRREAEDAAGEGDDAEGT